ncbi:MAG: S8 family serine peptidase [Pseudobdellovibrionaceae bacterium]
MNKMHQAVLGLAILLMSAQSFAAEYLVKYRSPFGIMSFSNKIQVMDQHAAGQLVKVRIPDGMKVQAMVDLFSNPNVEYVVPNVKLKAFTAPVDMNALKEQWAIKKVQAEAAWAKAGNKGSKQVVVAVIDTGVDYKHQSLAPNMVPGYDFARNDADPDDTTSAQNPGHGTHCAGIVGASGLVDGGIIGLSPEVSMMPIRFLDERGSGDLNNGIKSIDFAIEKGVDVISASWGAAIPRSQAQPLIEAVQRAEKAGIVFVVAASNDGKNNDSFEVYPAKAGFSNVIAVAASNSNDQKPSWSNFGKATVDVAAPGDGIMSTLPKDKYGNLSGTSMATPLVSGLVALIKAQDPSLKPEEIKSLIQATGAKVAIQTACDCRVDALAAVETAKDKKMFVHPNAATVKAGDKLQFTGVYGVAPFMFASSAANIGEIDANGMMTAKADGETVITVTDSRGVSAQSYKIYVGKPAGNNPGNPGDPGDPGNPGDCPLGDEMLCQIICGVIPDLPWCQK